MTSKQPEWSFTADEFPVYTEEGWFAVYYLNGQIYRASECDAYGWCHGLLRVYNEDGSLNNKEICIHGDGIDLWGDEHRLTRLITFGKEILEMGNQDG